MNCKIHIHLLNELYSQELADAKHNGKESADNLRYEWEDELEITTAVSSVVEKPDSIYTLAGYDENDTPFSYEIQQMYLFEIHSNESPIVFIGASKSIIDHCTLSTDDTNYTIRIFLKDYEPMANPIPGIFIASKAFPKALIR
jgi:hypothetical protein